MTASERLVRDLPGILDDLAAGPSSDFLDDVFAQTARMRQRPGWTFPERLLPMADIARTRAYVPVPPWRLVAVALLLIALVVAALLVAGSQRRVAPPFGPARNGEIVYDLNGDLYVANPETGETRLLVGGPEIDSAPGYSPDGTRIAFNRAVEGRENQVEIWIVNANGSDLKRITPVPIPEETWANWAPDSRHLALMSGGRLELIDADGKEAPLRPAPGLTVDALAFRPPDGQQIAVRAIVDGKYGVYAINADGTGTPTTILEPNVPLDMGNHALNMVYSPDGSRLYYQSYTETNSAGSPGCCHLWVVNADGTGAQPFESNGMAWSGVPSVSPDGRWVSYWYVGDDAPTQQIRVAAADGSGTVIATGPAMSDFFPWSWSPDSSKLLMMPSDGSTTSPYLIDPAGGSWSTARWESGFSLDWQRLAP